jgi:uncharacterized membrane protein YraQ (UPF0718 family)
MLDIKLVLLFTRVFSRRVILTIIIGVTVQTFVYTLIAHYLLPDWVGRPHIR